MKTLHSAVSSSFLCVTIDTVFQVKKVQADRAVVFQENENQARK